MVLIEEDKVPRNQWRMGIVVDLYKGKDDIVRGCKLRTLSKKGQRVSFINRPVTKLYPLEIAFKDSDNSNDGDSRKIATEPYSRAIPASKPNFQATPVTKRNSRAILVHDNHSSTRPRRLAAERGIQKRILGNHT